MKKFKEGDIFTISLPKNEFILGRILLDIKKQCVNRKLLPKDSPLMFFSGSILVEIYKERYKIPFPIIDYKSLDVLIPGIFTRTDLLKDGTWSIINSYNVNPKKVEFPEGLTSFGKGAIFRKGEVSIPLSLNENDLRCLNVYPRIRSPYLLPSIYLYYSNSQELIAPEYLEASNLSSSDLRYSEYRNKIYEMINEDKKKSYYEMALKLGYDLKRFYQ